MEKETKLLIVDDSNNNRSAINYWLKDENYQILHAIDGPSAIKLTQAFIPDIILLDYNLPGMDGIEVCQKIRNNKTLPFIPIIMMSSHAPEINLMALEQGADEFIVMPIKPNELKSRIKAMLRLKEAVSKWSQMAIENAKLQELDKIKSNFISKVSHELRTPLQAILGYTDILLEGFQGDLNYSQKLMVKQISESGSKLLDLISQILDFECENNSQISQISPEIFSIESLFNYITNIANPIALKKNIKLTFLLEDKNIQLESVKDYVQKIVLNLVSNSIKFSTEHSKVIISAKDLTDSIELKIQDEGIGIEKSNIAYIFDKFWQNDDSITRSNGGLGIGLTVAKKLTTILGGHISVNSKPNKGSTFIVTLPKEYKQHRSIIFEDKLEQVG